MKVKNAIDMLENVLTILKHYENDNLEDMLKDIKDKLQLEKSEPVGTKEKIEEVDTSFGETINQLEKMTKDEQFQLLSKYKKNELIKISAAINIKLQSRDKKDILIQTIVNHFSYIHLNEQMGKRPKQSI